jgi:hypothetical protein
MRRSQVSVLYVLIMKRMIDIFFLGVVKVNKCGTKPV